MQLERFSVSQVRVAATCPRILYFDLHHTRTQNLKSPSVTKIWKRGGTGAAGGQLFHYTIERFNREALDCSRVRTALESAETSDELKRELLRYINTELLKLDALHGKSLELKRAFSIVLRDYMSELSHIMAYAREAGLPTERILRNLFADARNTVDVSFHVGVDTQIHVRGRVDYVFYDWRRNRHRIFDYKLTPPSQPNNDLFQVGTYALMHNHQHGTKPGAEVFYLFPEWRPIGLTWDQVYSERNKVYQLIASMPRWAAFDESSGAGLRPPGNPAFCELCRWNRGDQCASRLGLKSHGGFDTEYTELVEREDFAQASLEPLPGEVDEVDSEELTESIEDVLVGPLSKQEMGDASREPRPVDGEALLRLGIAPAGELALPPEVLNTHVAVVGAAGSGKTWMAKVIAEEAALARVPIVAVDPQGDLVQFLQARDPSQIPSDLRTRYEAFQTTREVRVFTPGSSHGLRIALDPVRLPTEEDLRLIADPQRRAEKFESILTSVSTNLVNLADARGETDSQRTLIFKVLNALPKQEAVSLESIVAGLRALSQ